MATTYLLTDQAEAQGWVDATYEQKMLTSAGSPTTQSTSLASLVFDVVVAAFIAPEGAGTLNWIGAASLQLEVTTAAADIGVLLLLGRVTQDGAVSRGGSGGAYQFGTGLKSYAETWNSFSSSVNTNASRATTDRLRASFWGRNNNMMTAQTLAWAVNDPDSYAMVYWDVVGGATSSLPPRLASRARQHRIGR